MADPTEIARIARVTRFFYGPRTLASLLVLVGVAGCTEPRPRPVEELVRQEGIFLDPETMEPYTGPVFATFANQPQVIEHRLRLRNGTYHGPFEAYFANRQLSSKEIYQGGIKDGPYEWYFENGHIFERGTYHEGRLDGPYEGYWDDNALYEEGTYHHGEFDGPRRWYLDGKLIELVTYQNGVMEGLYERYNEDRTLDLKGMLAAGSPCGIWVEDDRTITYPACGTPLDD
ncbi:MAG: hypothetical protein IIC35_07850 [Gemmatimonadetes bacterium]|nr:hypothetical protein [Gemmatimonadota bacterium]